MTTVVRQPKHIIWLVLRGVVFITRKNAAFRGACYFDIRQALGLKETSKTGRFLSAPYRAVASRLKKLLSEGRGIEGALYRSDRGNTPRHQLPDRAQGKYRNIYVPVDFARDVAAWSANWAELKRLLKELSEIARGELVEAITGRTGRGNGRLVCRGSAGQE